MTQDRRKVQREATLIEGMLEYGRIRKRYASCLVTEVSGDGARIWLVENSILPKKFRIYIGQDDQSGQIATRVWRRDSERGVRFEKPAPAPAGLLSALLPRWSAA